MQRAKDAMKTGSKAVETVGKVVEATYNNPVVQTTGKVVYAAGETVVKTTQKIAEPIMETQAAKAVASTVKNVQKELTDNSTSAFYAEYLPKEEREKIKQSRLADKKNQALKLSASGIPTSFKPVTANDEAGNAVVMHRSSKIANAWNSFKENSPMAKKLFTMSKTLQESDHPILERVREFMANTRFNETEEAKVIKAFKTVDPGFRKDLFLKEMTRFGIPDIVEAAVKEDLESIAQWCSEKVFLYIFND